MRRNRRREPIDRESSVYLYGASRREVCRKVDPVGLPSALVRDQVSTPLACWPEPRNAVATKRGEEWAQASGSAKIEIVEFRSRSDGVRGVSQPMGPKSSWLSSSSPAIDVLRGLEPRPVLLVSEPKPNRRFPDCGGLSPNSRKSPLRLFTPRSILFQLKRSPRIATPFFNLRPIGLSRHLSTAKGKYGG